MGGGGGLLGGVTGMLFGEPDVPATPDYTGAAQATAAGNLDAARAAAAANRVNQVNPYGSLSYAVTGKDPYGNPTWTATTSLSPEQQQLYNYDVQSSLGLGALQNKGLNYVGQMIDQPFSTSGLPQLSSQLNAPTLQTDLQNQGMEGWDKASGLIMQRLAPQMERQQKSLDAQLANQGIMRGSQAYTQAQQDLAMKQNDLMNQAQLTGLGAQQQFFGQGLQAGQFGNTAQQQMLANQAMQADLANRARGQGFQELAYQRNEPINTLNAVRSGSQVTAPNQFYVNAPQQSTTAGADYLGAAGLTGNANIAAANASNAQRNAMMQGLFSIGSSYAGS
jgi:hypothetical protein